MSEGFDYSESYFAALDDQWTRVSYPLIASLLEGELERLERPVERALDLGCGNGAYFELLHGAARQVDGVDCSETSVRKCRARFAYGEVVQSDACRLPQGDASYDLVFSTEMLEHVEPYEAALREAARVLKPGGRFVFTTTLYWSSLWTYRGVAKTLGHTARMRLRCVLDYLRGFASLERRRRFIRQWCFDILGGHYHGFLESELAGALRAAGFSDVSTRPFYAFEPIPLLAGGSLRHALKKGGVKTPLLVPAALAVKCANAVLKPLGLLANNVFVSAGKPA